MKPTKPSARLLLVTTLLLALAGDLLLREFPWGVNFTLFAILLFGSVVLFAYRFNELLPFDAWVVTLLGLCTAAWFVVRDSSELAFFNFVATTGALALMSSRKRTGELAVMTFTDHVVQMIVNVYHVVGGFGILLFRDLREDGAEGPGRERWKSIWLGAVITIPALILFCALLMSADAVFESLMGKILPDNILTLVGHCALIGLFSWIIGGFLRGRYVAPEFLLPAAFRPRVFTLGITEIAMLLGALDLLFGLFVGVQIPYFFGGNATVVGTPSLSYAQYARRGFFELLAVAILSLPLLLVADWILRKENPRDVRFFQALATVMVALLGLMLGSGMYKLWIYMEAYGLTTTRLNAAAIMIWVGLTLCLFIWTVFRGRREQLPFAIVIAGFVVLIGLNAVNPEAVVARVNLERLAKDGKFDPDYTFRLGADAVPDLMAALPTMEEKHRSALAQKLLNEYGSGHGTPDIRTWNAPRAKALTLVRGQEAAIKGYILPAQSAARDCM